VTEALGDSVLLAVRVGVCVWLGVWEGVGVWEGGRVYTKLYARWSAQAPPVPAPRPT
jgi:hypothetical protein